MTDGYENHLTPEQRADLRDAFRWGRRWRVFNSEPEEEIPALRDR
jgi:hypothetical protein